MGHQYSLAPGRPIVHRRLILSQTSAGNSCKSSYVAMASPLAPVFPGHALTGLSTARGSSRSGRIGFDALESATLVEDCPSDTGEFVSERDRQHIAVQALLCRLDP